MNRNIYTLFLLTCWLFIATGLNAQTPVAQYSFSGSAKDLSTFANHASVNAATLTRPASAEQAALFPLTGRKALFGLIMPAAQLSHNNHQFLGEPDCFSGPGRILPLSCGGWQERWKVSLPPHGKPVFTTHPGALAAAIWIRYATDDRNMDTGGYGTRRH